MTEWIEQGIRMILWCFPAGALTLMDVAFAGVKKIASADFLKFSDVWNWYSVFMCFLGVLIIGRSIAMYFKFAFDEEFRDKLSAKHFINKFISIGLVMVLLPGMLGFISKTSLWAIDNISIVIGAQGYSDKPSTFILTAFNNETNGEWVNGDWVTNTKATMTIENVKINEKTSDGKYMFMEELSDLIVLFVIGCGAAFMLLLNAVQIGKRLFGILIKVIIAPIPISSLIVPGDETFTMWRKMIISDYLLNYIQTLMIILIMIVCGSKHVEALGVWIQLILLISGFLFLLSGCPELARILGGDTSQAGILQQAAAFRQATRGLGRGLSNIAKGVGAAAGGIGAAATYGLGRLAGGESISNMKEQAEQVKAQNANGFMGGNSKQEEKMNGYSSQSDNEQISNNQYQSSNSNLNSSSNSKENQSMNNENNIKDSQSFNATAGNNNMSQKSTNNETSNKKTKDSKPYLHASRPDTKARNLSDIANNTNGIKGIGARLAINGSKHMYQGSMNRLQQSKAFRAGSGLKGLTEKHDNNNVMRGDNNDIQ
ncbi:MAG: hypothetical protein RR929_01555 [Erysipelotrichaceae bacterium]